MQVSDVKMIEKANTLHSEANKMQFHCKYCQFWNWPL